MKTIKKQIKSIALILSFLILFQGCTVYKSVPISIEQAVQNESKVKVITKGNAIFKYKRIGIEDGNYYGYKVKERIPLDPNNIDIIKEKDKTLSTVLSIGIPVVIIGGLLAIAASSGASTIIIVPILPF